MTVCQSLSLNLCPPVSLSQYCDVLKPNLSQHSHNLLPSTDICTHLLPSFIVGAILVTCCSFPCICSIISSDLSLYLVHIAVSHKSVLVNNGHQGMPVWTDHTYKFTVFCMQYPCNVFIYLVLGKSFLSFCTQISRTMLFLNHKKKITISKKIFPSNKISNINSATEVTKINTEQQIWNVKGDKAWTCWNHRHKPIRRQHWGMYKSNQLTSNSIQDTLCSATSKIQTSPVCKIKNVLSSFFFCLVK